MALLESLCDKMYLIFCLVLASMFTYLQFKYYLSNEDLTTISYRKFATNGIDQYPTYTISLYRGLNSNDWRNKEGIFKKDPRLWPPNDNNIVPFMWPTLMYQMYLSGWKDINGFDNVSYDDVAIDLFNGRIVSVILFKANNGTKENDFRWPNFDEIDPELNLTLELSHQDEKQRCYTKKILLSLIHI